MEVHILVPLAWKIEDETKGSKSENSQIHIMDKQWHHGRMVWWEIKGSKTTDLPNSTPSMNHVRGGQAARRSGATGKRTGASIEGRHALSLCQFLPKNWVFKIFYSTSDMTFWHIFQNAPKKQRVCCLVFRGFSPICWGELPRLNRHWSLLPHHCTIPIVSICILTSGGGRKHRISQDLRR